MNKLAEKLRQNAVAPCRPLSPNFTKITLAKALAPQPASFKVSFKKRFFMKYVFLKPAPGLLALGILLTVSTAAFAASSWQQIQVLFTGSSHSKTFNATEFGFDYKSCDALGGSTHLRYGVAQAAKVSQQDIEKLIKARCEVAQAKQLFDTQADWQIKSSYIPSTTTPLSDYQFNSSIVSVDRIDGDQLYTSLVVQDPHGKPIAESSQETLATNLRVYQNGRQVATSDLKHGDSIVRVQYFYDVARPDKQNKVIQEKTVGLIKVNAQPVDRNLYDKVFEIKACQGNPNAVCVDMPSSALLGQSLNAQEGEGGNYHPRRDITRAADGSNEYEAQGRITAIDDTGFTLQAFESTQRFRVEIAAKDRTKPLQNGQAISVTYLQKPTEDHGFVRAGDIERSYLITTDQNTNF